MWREDRFQTKEEAFIWLAGHEAFHWLRHSRQIPGKNYETQANRYGFAWLDERRELNATSAIHDATGRYYLMSRGKRFTGTADISRARLCYPDGRVTHFDDQRLAYAVWLALPKGVLVAFRGANDTQPVYSWDYVDAL